MKIRVLQPATARTRRSLSAVTVMHTSSSWMLGAEEGLSGDLTGHSSRRQSDRCGRATRSGSDDNLSFNESEFLRKRNPKDGGE
jgi:hypothetical protein